MMKQMKTILFLTVFSNTVMAFTLALNWKAEPQFGGFYQTQIESPLPLQILQGGSGTPTVQMLANDKVDFATVSAEEILLSNERNPDKKVLGVFAAFQTNPQIFLCRPEVKADSIADIFAQPLTLSLQSGLSYAQFLQQKYPNSKVHKVPYLGGIATFLNQKDFCQQGFATSEPLLAEKNGLKGKVFMIADAGFNPYTTVLAVRESYLQNHRQQVIDFVTSVRKGWSHYLQSPKAANEKMAQLNKSMDLATFMKSAQLQVPLNRGAAISDQDLGKMSPQRWSTLIEQLHALQLLKNIPPANQQYENL